MISTLIFLFDCMSNSIKLAMVLFEAVGISNFLKCDVRLLFGDGMGTIFSNLRVDGAYHKE